MARIHGKEGTVTIAGSSVYGVTRWSFTPVSAADESTGMDSQGYRSYLQGLKSATLSVEGRWEGTGKPKSAKTPTDKVAFALTSDSGPSISLSGSGIITQSRVETPVDGASTFSMEIQVTGSWNETQGYA